MADRSQVTAPGISLVPVLGVVFLVLKLTHVIDWPWIWVLCPFWIGPAIVFGILLVIGMVGLIVVAFGK